MTCRTLAVFFPQTEIFKAHCQPSYYTIYTILTFVKNLQVRRPKSTHSNIF